ncbi:MAG: UDP-N-acetylmuramate--L-alanine ligase [bacterium]|nr:UDP-N-acetylmuramate--L-alanine ligase [bacterium]
MKKKKVHFVGIGGIGMSALARYFLAQNWAVSGSDLASGPITRDLAKVGIRVKIGHIMGNLPKNTHFIVFSKAVPSSNPEIRAARRQGTPCKSYAEALGDITREHETFAVTGAHGKSTTTSLLALAMIRAGLDPTVFVGTKLWEFGDSNFYFGKSSRLVVEADDYAETFLEVSPSHAIILNIDREHLDYYKSFARVKQAFLEFIANVRPGGILVLNKDNETLWELRKKILAIVKKHNLRLRWFSLGDSYAGQVRKALHIPGEHNVSNALAVYTLLREVGVRAKDITTSLSKFRGSWRRMEYKGTMTMTMTMTNGKRKRAKVLIYDDYGHHPTEIKATLQAFREKFPRRNIVCVFQPHQVKRLKLLFPDFVDAFHDADLLVLLPVYQVAGREDKGHSSRFASEAGRTEDRGINSERLATEIREKHKEARVVYLGDVRGFRKKMEGILREHIHSPAVLVMMGAGNIFELTSKLVQK